MGNDRSYYEILGISPSATDSEIKQRYRELAGQFHPDLIRDRSPGRRTFVEIHAAYRILSDPRKRAAYDNDRVELANARVDELIARSTRAFGRGDFLEARRCAEDALQVAPDHYYGHLALGDALVALKEIDAARNVYRRSISIQPSFIAIAKLEMIRG